MSKYKYEGLGGLGAIAVSLSEPYIPYDIPEWVALAVFWSGVVLLLGSIIGVYAEKREWKWAIFPIGLIGHDSEDSAIEERDARIPLIELRKEAKRRGWRFKGVSPLDSLATRQMLDRSRYEVSFSSPNNGNI